MTNLKQEMRQMFEKRSSMAFYENNSRFEEGTLEKILNLAFANLSAFSNKSWDIVAVKSPVLLRKLYVATGEEKVADSAFALVIMESALQEVEMTDPQSYKRQEIHKQQDLDLLALSISYAAKFHRIDSFLVRTFDQEAVARALFLDRQRPVLIIICLGFFTDIPSSNSSKKVLLPKIIRVI